MQPFPEAFPELEIINNLPLWVEYRVYNFTLAKDGSNEVRRRTGYSFWDLLAFVAIYALWNYWSSRWVTSVLLALFLRVKATQLLWESIVVLPHTGLQLQSTRGLSLPFTTWTWPITTSRRFIPADCTHDVIINEGLRRWDWYYYVAILCRSPPRNLKAPKTPYEISMKVAFENILPPFEVVREVYHGIRETLFDEFEEDNVSSNDQ